MRRRNLAKVTAFITRLKDEQAQVLVFSHPSAGLQIPAGTIALYETVEDGLLREIREETGLKQVEIVSELGSYKRLLAGDEFVILQGTKLFTTPEFDASSDGYFLDRGTYVREIETSGKFSKVLCDPLISNRQEYDRVNNVTGYVRSSLLGKVLTRYLFHVRPIEATQDRWEVEADGHLFRLFWTKLIPDVNLVGIQAKWLNSVYERLLQEIYR